MEKKKLIREEIGALAAKMTAAERALKSEEICRALEGQIAAEFSPQAKILFFVGKKDEPDLAPLFEKLCRGNTFQGAFPKVTDLENRKFQAVQVNEVSELKKSRGHFGLFEPEGSQVFRPEEIDLVLVPAVAVDASGNRLGHGLGFYDRFLKKVSPRCRKWAVIFSFQKVEKIPAYWHDVGVDAIVDECSFSSFTP